MTTCVFFDLPEVQQAAVLTQWLEFYDFRKFHCAVWNKQRRSELSMLLSSGPCAFVGGAEQDDERTTEWCIRNGIMYCEMDLLGTFLNNNDQRKRLPSHFSSTLHTVSIHHSHYQRATDLGNVFTDLHQLCPKLRSLTLSSERHWDYDVPAQIVRWVQNFIRQHTQLASIALAGLRSVSGDFLLELASAQSLRVVEFVNCIFTGFDILIVDYRHDAFRNKLHTLHASNYVAVCKLFPNITQLFMTRLRCKALAKLPVYCPHVRVAEISANAADFVFRESAVLAMAKHWPP